MLLKANSHASLAFSTRVPGVWVNTQTLVRSPFNHVVLARRFSSHSRIKIFQLMPYLASALLAIPYASLRAAQFVFPPNVQPFFESNLVSHFEAGRRSAILPTLVDRSPFEAFSEYSTEFAVLAPDKGLLPFDENGVAKIGFWRSRCRACSAELGSISPLNRFAPISARALIFAHSLRLHDVVECHRSRYPITPSTWVSKRSPGLTGSLEGMYSDGTCLRCKVGLLVLVGAIVFAGTRSPLDWLR